MISLFRILLCIIFLSSCNDSGTGAYFRPPTTSIGQISIQSVTFSNTPSKKIFTIGETITFQVNFSSTVIFTETPSLAVTFNSGIVNALSSSLGPANSFTFQYTIQNGDYDFDGISSGTSIALNGGTATGVNGETVGLSFTAPDLTNIYITKGNIYYIGPSGNDGNDGLSIASAWKTPAQISASTFAEGDAILLEGGETFSGQIYLDNTDTTSSSYPLVIDSYGTGNATVEALAVNGEKAFNIYNIAGLIIRNLEITGAVGSLAGGIFNSGIYFYNDLAGDTRLPFVRLYNLNVSGFGYGGVIFEGANGQSGYEDIFVSNIEVHNNHYYGFYTKAASTYGIYDITIEYSKFYDNSGISGLPSHSGNGLLISYTDKALIEHNIAYNNGTNNTNSSGPVGIWTFNSNDITIQYNESYANKTQGQDGGGFDFDGGVTNSLMQYNYSHDNDGAGFLIYQYSGALPHSNNVIRYNISENDGQNNVSGGFQLGGADGASIISNIQIYNNTVFIDNAVSTGSAAIYLMNDNVQNIFVRNNIFVTKNGASIVESVASANILFQGNNYYASGDTFEILWAATSYTSVADWQAVAATQEKLLGVDVYLEVDPLFNQVPGAGTIIGNGDLLNTLTGYQLQSNSPLIDAGLDLNSNFGLNIGSSDFYNNSNFVGATQDMGAYEAQ